ncbi:ATP-dependent sacrificial sulfur transferase LarE [Halanaerobaculum tunisiense]
MNLEEKHDKLQEIIEDLGRIVIGFSGGVDSTLLAKVSYDVLGKDALAVTAEAPLYAQKEIDQARKMAQEIGIKHQVVSIDDELMGLVKDNPTDRCYHCKSKIFSQVKEFAGERPVADGTNVDDLGDYRPGLRAIDELDVRSPLKEAGLGKEEIRQLSKKLDLSSWDDPSLTCLATRFPYGEEITEDKLELLEEAEVYLDQLGFEQFRVRYHGDLARIEVGPEERLKLFDLGKMDQINEKLQSLGFNYVTMDLGGYQTGNMNKTIEE